MAIKKRIIAALASALFAVSIFPFSALADAGPAYEKKDVTAYRYSMDKSETLQCLFLNDLPEVPYVNVEDYLDRIYVKDYTTSASVDVYTISGNGMTIVADTTKDTVTISGYDSNIMQNVVVLEKEDDPEYIKSPGTVINGTEKPVVLDYSKYSIDLIGDSGKLYFPLTTISDMFDCTYRAAEYIDGNLYFVATLTMKSDNDGYFDRSSVYKNTERSQAMADYTYNELCFFMDHFYGRPSKAPIAKSIAEKGFDKALDDYSGVKQLLRSTNRADFHIGTMMLLDPTEDGGHTSLCGGILSELDSYSEDEDCVMLSDFTGKMLKTGLIAKILNKTDDSEITKEKIKNVREEKLKDATLLKKWEDNKTALYVKGETALFQFGSFIQGVVDDFKWSLDYASKNGIKNFVIDIAANDGGDETIAHFINTIIANKQKNNNEINAKMRSTVSGNILDTKWISDLDRNGIIDDKDKTVYYDLNYAILTSSASFSSANLMPCMAKDNGILIIGETSGGGTCMLSKHYYPDGTYYMTSGDLVLLRGDKTDVESGAKVDFDLTFIGEDGLKHYDNFYDFAKLEECINKFYGIAPEVKPEVKPQEQPKVEPAKAEADKDAAPPTGHVGNTFTVTVLFIAVCTLAVKRKDEE